MFWAILYNGHWSSVVFIGWSTTSKHALNTVIAAFEIFTTRTSTPPILHLCMLIILLAFYLALAYLTHATEGFYPYDFLDDSNGHSSRVAAYAFAVLAAIVVIFGVVWGIIWLREWITEKKLGMEGRFSRARNSPDGDVEIKG